MLWKTFPESFLKNVFFSIIFRIWGKKNFGRRQNYFNEIVKTAFFAYILIYEKKSQKLLNSFFLSFLGYCVKNIWPTVEFFSTGLSKLHFRCPEDYLGIIVGKVVVFCYFRALSFKLSGFLAKSIDGDVETAVYVYWRIFEIFVEITKNFEKNNVLTTLRHWLRLFRLFVELFIAGLSKLHSSCTKEPFEETFLEKYHLFKTLRENISAFCQIFFEGFVKFAFPAYSRKLWGKLLFLKRN